MSTPLVDPQLAAFFAADPGRLTPPTAEPESVPDHRRELEIAIAAATLAGFKIVRDRLAARHESLDTAPAAAREAWRVQRPGWMDVVLPAITQLYRLGRLDDKLGAAEITTIATEYAGGLSDYIGESSADALAAGLQLQLNNGWNERVAWQRAAVAYGLDRRDMRNYLTKAMSSAARTDQLIDPAARMLIDKALLIRADLFGRSESWTALETGKALTWMYLQRAGRLPAEARRQWDTAEDEVTCAICYPFNEQQVPLGEPFVIAGRKLWAPQAHPGCRCHVKLVVPEPLEKAAANTPYNRRDSHGRWVKVGIGVAAGAGAVAGGVLLARKLGSRRLVPVVQHAVPRPVFGEDHALMMTRNSDRDYTWTQPRHRSTWRQRHPWLIGRNEYAVEANGRKWRLQAEGFHGGRGDNGGTQGRPVRYVFELQGDVGDDLGMKLIRAHASPAHQRALGAELDKIYNDSTDISPGWWQHPVPHQEVRGTLARLLNRMDLPAPAAPEHAHAERLMRGELEGTAARYQLADDATLARDNEEAKHHGAAVLRGAAPNEPLSKSTSTDPWDRNARGRFAPTESRRVKVTERTGEVDPAVADIVRQAREVAAADDQALEGLLPTADLLPSTGLLPSLDLLPSTGQLPSPGGSLPEPDVLPPARLLPTPTRPSSAEARAAHRQRQLRINRLIIPMPPPPPPERPELEDRGPMRRRGMAMYMSADRYNAAMHRPPGREYMLGEDIDFSKAQHDYERGSLTTHHVNAWADLDTDHLYLKRGMNPQDHEELTSRTWYQATTLAKEIFHYALKHPDISLRAGALTDAELEEIAELGGLNGPGTKKFNPGTIKRKIREDIPTVGDDAGSLGQAFGDYVTWRHPDWFGTTGMSLHGLLEAAETFDIDIASQPVDQVFAFDRVRRGDLHRHEVVPTGDYMVVRRSYQSSLVDIGDTPPVLHMGLSVLHLLPYRRDPGGGRGQWIPNDTIQLGDSE